MSYNSHDDKKRGSSSSCERNIYIFLTNIEKALPFLFRFLDSSSYTLRKKNATNTKTNPNLNVNENGGLHFCLIEH